MKRKGIIIAVMCIIAGAVACIGGFAAADWNVAALDSVPSTQMTFNRDTYQGESEWTDAVSSIEVHDAKGHVEVTRGDAFEVRYSECEYFRYDIEYKDGKFVMRYVELKPYFIHFDIFGAASIKFRIDVTLPESVATVDVATKDSSIVVDGGRYDSLSLHSANGSIRIDDAEVAAVVAKTTNSSITLDNCKVGTADLDTTSGSIRVYESTAASIDAETTNSSITFDDCKVGGLLKAKTSNGSIRVINGEAATVDVRTTNSSVRIEDMKATTVTAVTGNGSIKVDGLDAFDITLTTTNSSVKGTLVGSRNDYAVTSSTTNGSNNLSNGGVGPRTLRVTTTNGSIKIEFTD